MIKKILSSVVLVVVLLSFVVIAGDSMRFGAIDSAWGFVDQGFADPGGEYTDGASCLRYADGPQGSIEDPDDTYDYAHDQWRVVSERNNPDIQNLDTSTWNQVRYGIPEIPGYSVTTCWDSESSYWQNEHFAYQSGIAFKGIPAVEPISARTDFGELKPFPLGKFCHINNTISSSNGFNRTYANLTIDQVDCGPGGMVVANLAGDPLPGGATSTQLDYSYLVQFDETENYPSRYDPYATCPYKDTEPCADAVIPGQAQGEHLYCKMPSGVVLDYTVAFLGFTRVGVNESCSKKVYNPADKMPGIFISDENSTNCACVWAAITDHVPSAVSLNLWEASSTDEGIVLNWQTAFETDNIGFNIYRSASMLREEAVRVNADLIGSQVPAGSTFGADYSFVDQTASLYTTYFYWLEDVDVNGTVTTHGPIGAEWVE